MRIGGIIGDLYNSIQIIIIISILLIILFFYVVASSVGFKKSKGEGFTGGAPTADCGCN